MKFRRRDQTERPGIVRTARIDRRIDDLVARASPGDIAVIDVIDLDRGTAERLVSAGVAAVVNAAPSSSGRFPVNGAQTLLQAGVVLVDGVGGEVFARVRDGDTVRLDGATVYASGECVVEGRLQSEESVAAANESARAGLRMRVGGLVADAGRRLTDSDSRILEGDGFPALNCQWRDNVVVILTAASTDADLRTTRALVRRTGATVLAVGVGADCALRARIRPDLVVLGRGGCASAALDHADEVLVLDGADLDVPVPTGIPRAHASSIGSPEDTAILLAHARGAQVVVTCGLDESLGGLLDRSVAAGSTPLIAQIRGGGHHVTASAAAALRAGRSRPRAGVLVTAAVAVLALIGGVVLGAGPVGSSLDGGTSASSMTSAANARVAAAEQRAAAAAAFEASVAPALIGGRLTGHSVIFVAMPGATVPVALMTALGESGAAVSGPITLTDAYLDPARTRVLRDLVVQMAPTALQNRIRAQPPATDPSNQLDQVLASTLVTKDGAALGQASPAAATILLGLSRVRGLVLPPASVRTGDLVVLVVPARADAVGSTRGAAIAAAFVRQGRAVVVVSTGANSRASGGSVGVIRSVPGGAGLSTVDDGDRLAGRIATVLALDAGLTGLPAGAFGVAADASAPVPSIVAGTAARN